MKKGDTDRIVKYLEQNRSEMFRFLEKLVKTESPSRMPETQEEVFGILSKKLKKLGYSIFRFPGKETGGYIYARPKKRKGRPKSQLLIGHCDTVWPLGTLEKQPYKENSSKISGPGIFDMKAGLTQIVFALQSLKDLGISPSLLPIVFINSDEEIGSRETTPVIERLAKVVARAFVLEPPMGLDGRLKTARKGLGRFTITVKGKAAHAGLDPGKGASAIIELSHQIQKLFALNNPKKGITVNVGMIEGGVSANVVAPESKAMVDVRVLNWDDAKKINKKIHSLKPMDNDTELHIEGSVGRPPMERTKRNKKLWKIAKEKAALLGINIKQSIAGGGSDGNTTSQFTATLDGLGTVGDGAHATHEFIFKDKLIERTALLALLIAAEDVSTLS